MSGNNVVYCGSVLQPLISFAVFILDLLEDKPSMF